MAPVALGIEVAEIKTILQTELDARHSPSDLARDKRLAAHRRLVIKQNPITGIHTIGFTVVDRDSIRVALGHGAERARIERRGLTLRNFLHFAE